MLNQHNKSPSFWDPSEICLYGFLIVLAVATSALASNVPCMPRAGDPGQGPVCVCNSTYCDTVERPARLAKGQYYLYTTSNSTPGFSRTTGTFADSLTSLTDDEDVVFTINSSAIRQEVVGFGGSFPDAAPMVFNTLPEAAMDNLIQSYFGTSGIEYSLGRLPMGASDFSTHLYTYDDVTDDIELQYFNLTDEDYSLKIPLIKKIQEVSSHGLHLYACSWTPPGWMKSNPDQTGYVNTEYFDAWAKYHVKFLQAYKEQGVDIWGLSGGNEVVGIFLYQGIMNINFGQVVTAPIQTYWLKDHLYPQLKAANLTDVKFLAMDDQRMFIQYWMDRMAQEPEAYEETTGIAIHWYGDWHSSYTMLDSFHEAYPDKLIIYTESSINTYMFKGNAVELGSWNRGSAYMYNLMENFNHWANGYIDWNMALNTDGGPHLEEGVDLDAAVIVNETSGEFYKQPMFYAMGHFSKFIPPGSRIVEVTSNQNQTLSDSREPLADVVGISFGYVTVPSVTLCLASSNSDGSHTAIVYNSQNVTVRVKLEDPEVGSVSLDFEPNSINTFVYWL